jgi:glutaredoxin
MSIYFYNMPGCPYCVSAHELLADEIADGKIILKDSSETNDSTAFPYFVYKDKEYTGLPKSKENLFRELNYTDTSIENFTLEGMDTTTIILIAVGILLFIIIIIVCIVHFVKKTPAEKDSDNRYISHNASMPHAIATPTFNVKEAAR